MVKSTRSGRRLTENEAIFRKLNENVGKGFDRVKRIAESEGKLATLKDSSNLVLHFYCECADENCHDRIKLKVKDYALIHANRNDFVVVPGHEINDLEKTIKKAKNYLIVRKLLSPPENPDGLNHTATNN